MSAWQPIETAPIGEMVWLWNGGWRHPFPGRRTGDAGQVYVDTCEPEAKGWTTFASYWMPMSLPPIGRAIQDSEIALERLRVAHAAVSGTAE